MSVKEFKEGEHPGGFVGFRVATTVGRSDDFRQAYFSLSEYGWRKARTLARQLDKQWREEAAKVASDMKLKGGHKNAAVNLGVTGLRAYISVEKKQRGGGLKVYFSPDFIVSIPGYGNGAKVFRIKKLGYETAWVSAVTHYCKLHRYDGEIKEKLLGEKPDSAIFSGPLLKNLRQRGYKLGKKELEAMLVEADSKSE
jgi:hypothetical protein